jgi:hypothetical protein
MCPLLAMSCCAAAKTVNGTMNVVPARIGAQAEAGAASRNLRLTAERLLAKADWLGCSWWRTLVSDQLVQRMR